MTEIPVSFVVVISQGLPKEKAVHVVYFDLIKIFDRVFHDIPIDKWMDKYDLDNCPVKI